MSIVRALRIDRDSAGVLDIDFRNLANRRDACRADIRLRVDGKIFSIQIDVQRRILVGVRDSCANLTHPCTSIDHLLSRCNRRILVEDVFAVRLANAGVQVLDIADFFICYGRGELRLGLRHRRLDQRCIGIAASARRSVKRDIPNALRCGRRSKPLSNFHLAAQALLAVLIRCIIELVREGVQRRTHEILIFDERRVRTKTVAVRAQCDSASPCRLVDDDIAALHLRWCSCFMRKENLRIANIVIDRDVLVILLEDHPGTLFR